MESCSKWPQFIIMFVQFLIDFNKVFLPFTLKKLFLLFIFQILQMKSHNIKCCSTVYQKKKKKVLFNLNTFLKCSNTFTISHTLLLFYFIGIVNGETIVGVMFQVASIFFDGSSKLLQFFFMFVQFLIDFNKVFLPFTLKKIKKFTFNVRGQYSVFVGR